MKRLLKEPLLHFALLGAALFAAHGWMRPDSAAGAEEIVVSTGQVEHLAIGFSRTWQRPPTFDELKGLVDDYVKEEILGREAIALGLDRNDTVIRRRLRQKMEFVAEDLAVMAEPSEAELETYLSAHPDDFLEDSRTSFRHVFLREDRGERLESDAAELLAQLRRAGPEADVSMLGDGLLLPGEFTLERQQGVAAQFGSEFAEALDEIAVGAWAGPLRSAYGLHLVLVSERGGGLLPALDEVRDAVRRELMAERRERMNQQLVEDLLQKYQVTVEWPKGEDEASAATRTAAASR
jgi:hypothetical protein